MGVLFGLHAGQGGMLLMIEDHIVWNWLAKGKLYKRQFAFGVAESLLSTETHGAQTLRFICGLRPRQWTLSRCNTMGVRRRKQIE